MRFFNHKMQYPQIEQIDINFVLVKLTLRLLLMLLHDVHQLVQQELSFLDLYLNVFKHFIDILTDRLILKHIDKCALNAIFDEIQDYVWYGLLILKNTYNFYCFFLHETERNFSKFQANFFIFHGEHLKLCSIKFDQLSNFGFDLVIGDSKESFQLIFFILKKNLDAGLEVLLIIVDDFFRLFLLLDEINDVLEKDQRMLHELDITFFEAISNMFF